MNKQSLIWRKRFMSVAALFAGGATFTSCDSKIKSAVTTAMEDTLLSLLDPSLYINDGTETDTNE